MFAEKSEEDTYILPSSFDELRQFLNLPPVTDLDVLFKDVTDIFLFSISASSTSAALEVMNASNHYTQENEEEVHKAFVFYPTQIGGPLLQALPNDPRVLNMLCHRQVKEEEWCEV